VDALERIATALDATLTIALAPNRAKRRRGGR